MNNKTSVIMPTYNKAKFLNLTLAGFTLQTNKKFEIVVVDDGSVDNTKSIVDSYCDKLDIIYIYQKNSGRSIARNTGLKYTDSNHIIFCDDDRIPSKTYIETHQKNVKENVAIVGIKERILARYYSDLMLKDVGLQVLINRIIQSGKDSLLEEFFSEKELIENFENIICTYETGKAMDNYLNVIEKYGHNLEGFHMSWIIGTTANMSFIRTNINDFLFDENYISWGMEDTDFSYMLYQYGYRFRFVEQAHNYHQLHPSNFSIHRDSMNKNLKYFCQKYNDLSCYLFANLFGIKKLSIVELNELLVVINSNSNEGNLLQETLKSLVTNTIY